MLKPYLFKTIYLFSIMLVAFYCFKSPFYNWDMVPYTALILKMDHYNATEVHALAYKLVKENIPAENYQQLTDSSHTYRTRMLNNAEAFESQLPFYVVKPLYIGLTYLFYKSGVGLPQAMQFPSLISYLLIGLFLFHWLSIYLRLPITFFVALSVMASSPLIEVTKTSSPDCLSALFLFGVFYFIIEKPSLRTAFILMCLSVFARLDNFLSCFILLFAISFSGKWRKRISLRTFVLLTSLLAVCYIITGVLAKQYHWSIFFYTDFASRLHPLYGSGEQFSLKSYTRLMYEHAINGINHSYLAVFMALLFLNFNKVGPLKKLSFEVLFALLIPIILLSRFILYPDISDRFYIAFYLVIIILTTKKIWPSLLKQPIKKMLT